jgi:ligand-binding sensor domain-containing protein/signal transduction histidine kinase
MLEPGDRLRDATACSQGILLLGLLSLLAVTACSQVPDTSKSAYRLDTWKTEQGLPENRVACLFQSHAGYLWVGTGSGVARFDGLRFRVFELPPNAASGMSSCRAFAEDREGNLWVATKAGVMRLAGQSVTAFSTRDGLCGEETTSIAVGTDGSVWIGTEGGINRFSNEAFVQYVPPPPADRFIRPLHADGQGRLWFGTRTGLYRLDPVAGHFEQVWQPDASLSRAESANVRAIAEDRNATLWFGTDHGLYSLDNGGLSKFTTSDGLASDRVMSIYVDPEGRLWVIAGNKLYVRSRDRFVPYPAGSPMSDTQVLAVLQDREENLWIGTAFGGLHRLNPQRIITYTTADGLCDDSVTSVCEGRDGGLWVATDRGASRFKDGRFTTFVSESFEPSTGLRSVLLARDGSLFLGSAYAGFYQFQSTPTGWTKIPTAGPAPQVRTIYEDRGGTIWVGAQAGLGRILPKARWLTNEAGQAVLRKRSEEWLYTKERVFCVRGDEWWECKAGTLTHRNPKHEQQAYPPGAWPQLPDYGWDELIPKGELSNYDVWAILQDRAGALWFGTAGGGLNRLHHGQFTAFTSKDGLASDYVWSIHEDSDGVLWIGTRTGLSRFEGGRFSTFTTNQGLHDDLVNHLLEDDFGNLWIGCNRGICRIKRSELNDVAEGRRPMVHCVAYGETDGMLSSETSGGSQPAGCKTRDGKLWFPTTRGLVMVDPAKFQEEEPSVPVLIEQMRATDQIVFGGFRSAGILPAVSQASSLHRGRRDAGGTTGEPRIQNPESRIRLPPGSGQALEFQYTALDLTAPDRVHFRYRLEGQDRGWIEAGSRRVAQYTNLRPGHYRFQVIAASHHGVWNRTGASVTFSLAPHFYQTAPFYGLCVLTIALAGYGLREWRAQRQMRIQTLESQLALEQQRTRITREIHDGLGENLKQIELLTRNFQLDLGAPHPAAERLDKIAAATQEAWRAMEEIHWSADAQYDNLRSLVIFLRRHLADRLGAVGLAYQLELPQENLDQPVSSEVRHHVVMALKEALRNLAQHAHATHVQIGGAVAGGFLTLRIADNGRGFDPATTPPGRTGLRNMESRMREVGGQFFLTSQPGQGTTVEFRVPLHQPRTKRA